MQTPDPAPRMGLQVSQTARPATLQTRAGQLWGGGSNALGNARGECLADLPGNVRRGMRNVPHPIRANLGSSEHSGHVEGVREGRDG